MGSALHFSAQATPVWGDLGFYDATARARLAGRTLLAALTLTTWEECGLGWHTAAAVADPDGFSQALQANGTDGQLDNQHGQLVYAGLSLATSYPLAFVQGATRNKTFAKIGSSWKTLWIGTDTTDPVYAAFANLDGVGSIDDFRVIDLSAPPFDDYGLATQRLAGARSAGDTFTHTAGCIIEWTQTTVPTAGYVDIGFRRQDATHQWYVRVDSGGALILVEYDGSETVRGSSAGVIANGDRIVVIAEGTTIRVYEANTLRITYASAASFAAQTAGIVKQTGTGGAVSDIITWPRTLTGSPAAILDQVSA